MAAETAATTVKTAASDPSRGNRRTEIGIVVSDARQKTITVEVQYVVKHARYGKFLYRSTKLHVHDEKNEAKKGDRVEVTETRPLSKQKRWRLVRVVERAVVLGGLELKEVEGLTKHKPEGEQAGAPPAAGEGTAATGEAPQS
jgi:small subunit ribosomal protein S17